MSISLWASLLSAQTTVLFLGNSYTAANDLPNTFRQLALSLGEEVTVSASTPGGYTLEQHATYAPSLSLIDAQPWDFVVMQEQSQLGALPVDVTNTELGATQLLAEIEENYECTYPVFYMTWGRQNGDPDNCPAFPFMYLRRYATGLRNNYVALANWNDAYTAPVGVAGKQVRDTHPLINLAQPSGYRIDPSKHRQCHGIGRARDLEPRRAQRHRRISRWLQQRAGLYHLDPRWTGRTHL
ncbi:MAG: hypothetical protein IPO56_17230 [Flavobacteriales bacterium]|nr:hypothetical protein [Flavobacteriales bacterium]